MLDYAVIIPIIPAVVLDRHTWQQLVFGGIVFILILLVALSLLEKCGVAILKSERKQGLVNIPFGHERFLPGTSYALLLASCISASLADWRWLLAIPTFFALDWMRAKVLPAPRYLNLTERQVRGLRTAKEQGRLQAAIERLISPDDGDVESIRDFLNENPDLAPIG